MVTGILYSGLALALALLIVIRRRLADLPSEVWFKMRGERDEATLKALDAMKEGVATRVGTSVIALRQYEHGIAETFRATVADAETRARVSERRASEVADVLGEARGLVRELRETLDAAREASVRRLASQDRSATPTAPPSEPPPGAEGRATLLPNAVPEGEDLGDDEQTRVGRQPAGMTSALHAGRPK